MGKWLNGLNNKLSFFTGSLRKIHITVHSQSLFLSSCFKLPVYLSSFPIHIHYPLHLFTCKLSLFTFTVCLSVLSVCLSYLSPVVLVQKLCLFFYSSGDDEGEEIALLRILIVANSSLDGGFFAPNFLL